MFFLHRMVKNIYCKQVDFVREQKLGVFPKKKCRYFDWVDISY